ncbi:hypothetical protein PIB30_033397 [Stylosanthes scabra]|uniref:Uncharacterized protein n=1 Tax=Stylosanthes scabra TaxID=79078 RepID=A0ABU6QD74_9FABA|nr:hypothetical protein [Stylosanthes scabra]
MNQEKINNNTTIFITTILRRTSSPNLHSPSNHSHHRHIHLRSTTTELHPQPPSQPNRASFFGGLQRHLPRVLPPLQLVPLLGTLANRCSAHVFGRYPRRTPA